MVNLVSEPTLRIVSFIFITIWHILFGCFYSLLIYFTLTKTVEKRCRKKNEENAKGHVINIGCLIEILKECSAAPSRFINHDQKLRCGHSIKLDVYKTRKNRFECLIWRGSKKATIISEYCHRYLHNKAVIQYILFFGSNDYYAPVVKVNGSFARAHFFRQQNRHLSHLSNELDVR